MNKVKYTGRTSNYLTKDKVYDVIQYAKNPIDNNEKIILINDRGIYDTYFLHYPVVKASFEDVSVQYRNDVIAEILS